MISVIVPVYNTKTAYLEQCVNSVLTQSYHNIQLILVDDGSRSECADALDKYQKQDSRCLVFHIPHGGVSNARNYGIDHAKGEYVAFIDSDDWVSEVFLEALLQKIDDAKMAIMASVDFYQDTQQFANKVESHKATKYEDGLHIFEVLYGCTEDAQRLSLNCVWAKLYRMDIIREGNIKFDTSLRRLEDGVFNLAYLTCLHENISCIYIDTVGYYLRQHGESTVHKFNPNLAEDMILPLKKMYNISVQRGMYEENKAALAYRALLNCIVYINDGACGNKSRLMKSVKDTKAFIKNGMIRKLMAECNLSKLNRTERMVARSIQQSNAWKPTLYFWMRKKFKH